MHESILKTLDSFNGPFGFGMGFEAAGQVVLFLTILSMGMAMVSCGLLSSGLIEAKWFMRGTYTAVLHDMRSPSKMISVCLILVILCSMP